MIYKNEGDNAIVKKLSHKLDMDGMLTYQIEFPSGDLKEIPREFLSRPSNPDVADIPSTIPQVQKTIRQLSDELIRKLANPTALTPAEQEFLDLHHRLFHLPYSVMFRLAKIGFLPKHLLRLKDRPPPCASCLFGTQHRTNWRTKATKTGTKSLLRRADLS